MADMPDQPRELRLDQSAANMRIEWPDRVSTLPFRLLRERCPCAECRSVRNKGGTIEAAAAVRVDDIVPYGANAIQLVFSDGHARGIFPFAYLRELDESAAPE